MTTYYMDKDSVRRVGYDDEIVQVTTYRMRNDSLFVSDSGITYTIIDNQVVGVMELMGSSYMVMDPADQNKCDAYKTVEWGKPVESGRKLAAKVWIESTDSTLVVSIQYEKQFGSDNVSREYYSKVKGTTSILRKMHPAKISKNRIYWDLLGRTVK